MTIRPLSTILGYSSALNADASIVSAQVSLDRTVRELRTSKASYKEATRKFQERFVVSALLFHACHLGRAAQELGMHRNTLTRTIRELNIDIRQVRNNIQELRRRKDKGCD